MIRLRLKKTSQSAIEFVTLVVFILGIFLIFQKFIVRGLTGRWKAVGDSLGQERSYDPNKTAECRYAAFFDPADARWFNQTCFEINCMQQCLSTNKKRSECNDCLGTCATPVCD